MRAHTTGTRGKVDRQTSAPQIIDLGGRDNEREVNSKLNNYDKIELN